MSLKSSTKSDPLNVVFVLLCYCLSRCARLAQTVAHAAHPTLDQQHTWAKGKMEFEPFYPSHPMFEAMLSKGKMEVDPLCPVAHPLLMLQMRKGKMEFDPLYPWHLGKNNSKGKGKRQDDDHSQEDGKGVDKV